MEHAVHRVGLFAAVAVAIGALWWWLGAPVAMPPSPLAPGEKLYCVSYAPFRADQTPLDLSTRIDPAQIEDDLARLARVTDCIRTYSTDLGLDRIADIAGRHGLKVIQGLWLGSAPERNRREIAAAVEIVRRNPGVVRALVVGNEVLLRGEMSAVDLANAIRGVKAQVSVPVTYADVWEFWLRNRELAQAADFVTIHILPYWEDFPITAAQAAAHVQDIRRQVAERFPGMEILIGEVGWPSAGRMREGAQPSAANQARVLHEVLGEAKRDNYRINVIEAFDQPWKRQLEGTVGGHWGLLDAPRRAPKFTWGAPVSNHPNWIMQALAGIVLAALVFAAAARTPRAWPSPDKGRLAPWYGVALIAATGGALVGWAAENAVIESLGWGGWLRSGVLVALAVIAPIVAASALAGGHPIPAFARVVGRREERPRAPVAFVLGLTFVVLVVMAIQVALGLVFDPRYKDFLFAPLSGAIVPFALLSVLGRRVPGRRGRAELVAAAVLAGSIVYVVLNESFANWQAVWFAGVVLVLAVTLCRSRDAPD